MKGEKFKMQTCYASEVGLRYDHPNLQYIEIIGNDQRELLSKIGDMNERYEISLLSAIKRAKKGESNIYALSSDEYGNIKKYIIDDYDAVLYFYGLLPSGHIHHLTWEYMPSDDGKSRYANVKMTMNCGCRICLASRRILAKELRNQHGLDLVMSSIDSSAKSESEAVKISRCSIRNKEHSL